MKDDIQYWRISPGQGGFLWREQKLNDCIAIGWSEIGNAKHLSEQEVRSKFKRRRWTPVACKQFLQFRDEVKKGDKVVASASGKGVYALGTIIGDYEFNRDLDYKHSRKVRWETTFWDPIAIRSLHLLRRS